MSVLSRTLSSQVLLQCEVCAPTFASGRSRSSVAKYLHNKPASRAAVVGNPFLLGTGRSGPSHHPRQSLSYTPRWSNESIAAVKDKYEAKYAERLKQKAKEKGYDDIDQLKREILEGARLANRAKDVLSRPKAPIRHKAKQQVDVDAKAQEHQAQSNPTQSSPPASSTSKPASSSAKSRSPIKPLADIIDIPKLLPQTADAVATIWNGFHQMQGPDSRTLSAVIPYEIYAKMENIARKYPQFVVPLPREVVDEQGEKREGAEMHFLQWAFLPRDEANPNVPPVSTVLYTPLAHYKSQQTFAQPHLILTHYSDLVPSHGIVLMRGDVSQDVSTTPADAQLLVLRLQQFYQDKHEARAKLLRTFHEDQASFDIDALIKSVGEI